MLLLFASAIFVGAALLFLVQPMIAKMVLPVLGGSPAVWNTCMVFFQAALLLGYAWAHWSVKWLGVRRQAWVHALAMALAMAALPIALPGSPPAPEAWPVPWLLGALAAAVGLPFVMASTGGPVLQRWFSATGHRAARDPYFLYAASNAGSLLALVAYPLVIEPTLTLARQRSLWAVGYGVFVVLVAACATVVWRTRGTEAGAEQGAAGTDEAKGSRETREPETRWWRWKVVGLAFVPSSLMLGVTQYLTTDIAAFPLMWIVPLAIYLLTFILAFASRRVLSARGLSVLTAIVLAGGAVSFLAPVARFPAWAMFGVNLSALAVVGLLCHTRLADSRPSTSRLTEFYLLMSVGGVLGGVFNALVAPLLFNVIAEYPIVLVLACLCRLPTTGRMSGVQRGVLVIGPIAVVALAVGMSQLAMRTSNAQVAIGLSVGIPAAMLYLLLKWSRVGFALGFAGLSIAGILLNANQSDATHRERTFFGVHRIEQYNDVKTGHGQDTVLELLHSTTIHGMQFLSAAKSGEPMGYYHREGPLGDVFSAYGSTAAFGRIGLVGLGTGAIAAYGKPGQEVVFHEIDPVVVRLSRSGAFFTYVPDAEARGVKVRVALGDGRRTLEATPDGTYGLIVLDAFSSDAIPVHLMTREATAMYMKKLAPGGVLAFHVSNQYMRLSPVVARISSDLGLAAVRRYDDGASGEDRWSSGRLNSDWIVLARTPAELEPLVRLKVWERLTPDPKAPLWTDEFSNVVGVMQWE